MDKGRHPNYFNKIEQIIDSNTSLYQAPVTDISVKSIHMMQVGVHACYVVIDKNGKSLTTCKIMILRYVGFGLVLKNGDKTVQKNRTSIDAMMHAEHLQRRYCLAFTQLAFFSFFSVFFFNISVHFEKHT
jgi:hypothetical protein